MTYIIIAHVIIVCIMASIIQPTHYTQTIVEITHITHVAICWSADPWYVAGTQPISDAAGTQPISDDTGTEPISDDDVPLNMFVEHVNRFDDIAATI